MDIFAITITWNGEEHLKRLKPSLDKTIQKTKCDNFYWCVRDNGSSDGTKDLFSSWETDKIRYFRVEHNRDNYAKCHNYLYEKIKELGAKDNDWILFLNNDIEIIDYDSINKMIVLDNDNVGAIGCKLLYPSGKLQHCGVIFAKEYGYFPFHLRRGENDGDVTSINRKFQAVTFAFALVKVGCFSKLREGKMDERFYWCFDDVVTCLDINKLQNKDIIYCGKTNIIHHESETLKKNPINILYQKHNFSLFRTEWFGKYDVDHGKYLSGKEYNKV